jgi:hypothetical protein
MSITEKRYVLTRWRERRMWRQRSTLPFNPSDCTCCVWNHRNMPEGADRSGFCYQLGEQPKKICDERLALLRHPPVPFAKAGAASVCV